MLERSERGQLRAHLRECDECATLARRQRATRTALKALGAIPLPSSLLGLFGGGSAVGLGLAAKAAMVVAAGVVVGGGGYEATKHVDLGHPKQAAATKLPVQAAPTKTVPGLPKHASVHVPPRTPVKALLTPAAKPKANAKAKAKPKHVAKASKTKQRPAVAAAAVVHPPKVHREPTNPVKRPRHEPMNPVKRRPVQPSHTPTVAHATKLKPEHPAKPVTPAPPKPENKGKKPAPPAVTVPASTDSPNTPVRTTTTPPSSFEHGNPARPTGPPGPQK
jgi:hypothetical protein